MRLDREYKDEGLRQLKEGKKCDSCDETAVVVYCTSCHGYWFMCEGHNKGYQYRLNKDYPQELWDSLFKKKNDR